LFVDVANGGMNATLHAENADVPIPVGLPWSRRSFFWLAVNLPKNLRKGKPGRQAIPTVA
jgi:hypothetical protein